MFKHNLMSKPGLSIMCLWLCDDWLVSRKCTADSLQTETASNGFPDCLPHPCPKACQIAI